MDSVDREVNWLENEYLKSINHLQELQIKNMEELISLQKKDYGKGKDFTF